MAATFIASSSAGRGAGALASADSELEAERGGEEASCCLPAQFLQGQGVGPTSARGGTHHSFFFFPYQVSSLFFSPVDFCSRHMHPGDM